MQIILLLYLIYPSCYRRCTPRTCFTQPKTPLLRKVFLGSSLKAKGISRLPRSSSFYFVSNSFWNSLFLSHAFITTACLVCPDFLPIIDFTCFIIHVPLILLPYKGKSGVVPGANKHIDIIIRYIKSFLWVVLSSCRLIRKAVKFRLITCMKYRNKSIRF